MFFGDTPCFEEFNDDCWSARKENELPQLTSI